MNAGEYVGRDGRIYRWVKTAPGYTVQQRSESVQLPTCPPQPVWNLSGIKPEDLSAAKAALDELIEAEEWVEWTIPSGMRYRARGDEIQWWYEHTAHWRSENDTALGYSYHKGREVAQAEHDTKWEPVRELVGLVMEPMYGFDCSESRLQRAREAAKKVQL